MLARPLTRRPTGATLSRKGRGCAPDNGHGLLPSPLAGEGLGVRGETTPTSGCS
jgi:hypothetical protein